MATRKAAARKKSSAKKSPARKAAAKGSKKSGRLSVADHIKANNKALGAAAAAGDAKAVGKMYTSRAHLLPPNAGFFKGIKAITGFWQGAIDMGIRGVALKSTEVEHLGTTAIEVGTYKLSTGDGSVLDTGKYVVVWKKDGGAWKLHRDIFNSSVEAAAA